VNEELWCDNCGEPNADHFISQLVIDIDSANSGESAVLCHDCFVNYRAEATTP
jgi:hypothetical protein